MGERAVRFSIINSQQRFPLAERPKRCCLLQRSFSQGKQDISTETEKEIMLVMPNLIGKEV
ncbi:hypothetical protein ABD76_04445 [Paenibacillus dendritiformis]|nr:hypothetical protein [Paenibacillus dendritiformis]